RETERRGLHLLTPRGEATWRRGAQDSVIDLTFATDGLQQSVTRCGPMDGWAIALDHIPIDIRLSRACHPRPPSRRHAISKLRRGGRSAWRRFIQEITTSKQLPHNKVSGECPDGASRHQARAQPTCRPYGVTTRSK